LDAIHAILAQKRRAASAKIQNVADGVNEGA